MQEVDSNYMMLSVDGMVHMLCRNKILFFGAFFVFLLLGGILMALVQPKYVYTQDFKLATQRFGGDMRYTNSANEVVEKLNLDIIPLVVKNYRRNHPNLSSAKLNITASTNKQYSGMLNDTVVPLIHLKAEGVRSKTLYADLFQHILDKLNASQYKLLEYDRQLLKKTISEFAGPHKGMAEISATYYVYLLRSNLSLITNNEFITKNIKVSRAVSKKAPLILMVFFALLLSFFMVLIFDMYKFRSRIKT